MSAHILPDWSHSLIAQYFLRIKNQQRLTQGRSLIASRFLLLDDQLHLLVRLRQSEHEMQDHTPYQALQQCCQNVSLHEEVRIKFWRELPLKKRERMRTKHPWMGEMRLRKTFEEKTREERETSMARLLSVNVGLPRDIAWRGETVRTAIWKEPVQGRRMVRRLNIDGDGQGDLVGHGGEQRAVFVYQIESYHY